MKELLLKYNFTQTSEENEWTKGEWTIRFAFDIMEAFNTPRLNTPGWYHVCEISLEHLTNILSDIDDFINKK